MTNVMFGKRVEDRNYNENWFYLYIYDSSSTNMINKDSQPSVDQNVMMWK